MPKIPIVIARKLIKVLKKKGFLYDRTIIFPGIFGMKNISDLLPLLIINLPSGILALLAALKLKEDANEQ